DYIQAPANGGQEVRDFVRVVLQVGVERHHHAAARRLEPGLQRRRLAEVPAEADAADAAVGRRQFANGVPGTIGTAVVHEDDFEPHVEARGDLGDLGKERG